MENLNQITVLTGCYSLLFLLCLWVWKMKSENSVSIKVMNGNWNLLHLRHAGGALIMALLPALLLPVLPEYLLVWPDAVSVVQGLTLIATGLLLLALVINHRDRPSWEGYGYYKGASIHATAHIVLRSLFLICYEWFFRGCLLFCCISIFGTTAAIIINLVLYMFIHSFNGKKEMIGSIPFGLILCVFTVWYQSVWPAIFLHLLLSLSYESFLLQPFFKKSTTVL